MNETLWPLGISPLPLDDSPAHDESVGYRITFQSRSHARIAAIVRDELGWLIDVILAHNFMDAYDTVRKAYPQARWEPDE